MSKIPEEIIAKRGYPGWIEAPVDQDGESLDLYIGTYPAVSRYLARRIGDKDKTLAELCCGIGASSIYLAGSFRRLIGVDLNQDILDYFNKNMAHAVRDPKFMINGYASVLGDVEDANLIRSLAISDVVAYDIPYWSDHEKDLTNRNPDLPALIKNIQDYVTQDIVIYTPADFTYERAKRIFGPCEYEQIYIDGNHDRNLIYLGSLKDIEGDTRLDLEA